LSHLSPHTHLLSKQFPFDEEEQYNTLIQWACHSIYWSDTLVKEFMTQLSA